jgi:threonine dehydrogenase-like Zn-dependent dehydrogenase
MKAGVFYGPLDIRVEEVADPIIQVSTDAVVKITYTCICGSDLWWYRGITKRDTGGQIGHEFMGEVIKVGNEVKNVKIGDMVVGPFFWCDGTCPLCKKGMSSACLNGGSWGTNGTRGCQAEQLRVPFADANLFTIPKGTDEKLLPAILTLSDVMGTGHHAAVSSGVTTGSVVAVIGDGAVGLCAVLASKRLGAAKIILMSRHEKNATVGKEFGATDIIAERGEEGITKVKGLTENIGADCVLDCVGGNEAREMAMGIVRDGGRIGCVGIPHDVQDIPARDIFWKNITIGGGIAPTATYTPELLKDVLSGKIDPSPVFDMTLPLSGLAKGYEAMDQREAIKVLIRP